VQAMAALGPMSAVTAPSAVEDEIDAHYGEQRRSLGDADPELAAHIEEFQAEELEHRDIALAHGAEEATAYPLLYSAIRAGCRAAIALSKRI